MMNARDEGIVPPIGGTKRGRPKSLNTQICERFGISRRNHERAIFVLRHGIPELVAFVECGELGLGPAEQVAQLPQDFQRLICKDGAQAARQEAANMSYTRRHSRPDTAQEPIVDALREAGVKVWVIGKPCDLLTLYAGRWLPLEVKSDTSSARNRKDQDAQKALLASTHIPVVTSAAEALAVIQISNGVRDLTKPADAQSIPLEAQTP